MCENLLAACHPEHGEGFIDLNTISNSKKTGPRADFTPTEHKQGDTSPKNVKIKDFTDNLKGRSLKNFQKTISQAIRAGQTAQRRLKKNGTRKIGKGKGRSHAATF